MKSQEIDAIGITSKGPRKKPVGLIQNSGNRSKRTHWQRSLQGIRDIYKVMQFLCCTFILVGKLFKFIGFTQCAMKSAEKTSWVSSLFSLILFKCEQDDPQLYCDDSYLKTGYSLIGIGATICILNLLHWFELSHSLGPIIVSLHHTVSDILKILTTFLVFLFAFSVGLHFSLRLSNMYCKDEIEKVEARSQTLRSTLSSPSNTLNLTQSDDGTQECRQKMVETNLTGFSLEDNVNHFRHFKESVKICFWSLFDPGHPEVIGCTQVHYFS